MSAYRVAEVEDVQLDDSARESEGLVGSVVVAGLSNDIPNDSGKAERTLLSLGLGLEYPLDCLNCRVRHSRNRKRVAYFVLTVVSTLPGRSYVQPMYSANVIVFHIRQSTLA